MNKIDTWCDPSRTISACRLNGITHITIDEGRQIKTVCGLDVTLEDLLILRQKPEDITCEKCKKSLDK